MWGREEIFAIANGAFSENDLTGYRIHLSVVASVFIGVLIVGQQLESIRHALPTVIESEPQLALVCTIIPLRTAVSSLEDERQCVVAERDAFDKFAREVASMSVPAETATPAGAAAISTVDAISDDQHLRAVRKAYRETVMAVSHFEEQWDETLRESLAAEFTEDLATAIVDGRRFSELLKQAVTQHALEASRRRTEFLDTVQEESTALTDAQKRLRRVDTHLETIPIERLVEGSFSDLVDYDRELQDAFESCEALLEDRQRVIHAQNRAYSRGDDLLVQQYFYQGQESSFPVLSATMDRIRRIQKRRQALLSEVIHRE